MIDGLYQRKDMIPMPMTEELSTFLYYYHNGVSTHDY